MGFKRADVAVSKHMPKINPLIGNGISYTQMKAVEKTIDSLMQVAFRSDNCDKLPEGLNYLTYQVLSSEETHKHRIEQIKNSNKPWRVPFTLAKTDSYLVKYIFENKGDAVTSKFEIFIHLPFVRRGGVMSINGKDYTVSSVIKTRGISVTDNGYFIKFLPNKVNVEYFTVSMIAGMPVHVPIPITEHLHRKGKYSTKRKPCLPFWIYARYGVTEAFKRYLDADIKIIPLSDEVEVSAMRNSKEWVVCEQLKLDQKHQNAQFVIAVPVDRFNDTVRSMVASIFHLTNELGMDMPADLMDDPVHWQILLGRVIFGLDVPKHHLLTDVENHLYQIESYMDEIFQAELISEGIEAEVIYDFIFYIVNRLATRRTADLAEIGNLWGRYYTSLEYVLYDLQQAIMKERWSLQNAASSSDGTYGHPKSTNYIKNSMRKALGQNMIRNLVGSNHAIIKALDTTSDNMIIGGCTKALDQSVAHKSEGGGRGRGSGNSRARLLHPSHLTHGSVLNLQQGDPTPINTIPPYAAVDAFGKIIWEEDLKPVVKKIALNFKRKSE